MNQAPTQAVKRKQKSIIRILACPILLWTLPGSILLAPAGFGMLACAAAEAEDDGAEVLTRGPVHEAFADTVIFKPTSGLRVPKVAPAAIEELPPDQRPDGNNVSWIPGYWAWEDDGNEFLWVSGIWRNLPPGRQWVPGYWQESGQEYQWTSGYWADAAAEEVEYLPEPPASVDAGPNIERPSRNSIWISGSWDWNQNRYRWRPGYWDAAQPDWVWMPAHYVWTRRGYIFVDGYWDYAVARRGMIFAPVRFRGDYYARPDYYYRPSTVISLAVFASHLFLRPVSRHYYFGDYYEPQYRRSGYYASYSYYSGGYGYDPIFAHQRWIHRDDDRWERRREENFRYYRDNRDERPPHTYAALATFASRKDKGRLEDGRREDMTIAAPLAQFVSSKESTIKFKPVDAAEKEKFAGRGREIRKFGEQRRELSSKGDVASVKGKADKIEPVRVKLPKSPLAALATEKPAAEDTPPKRPEVKLPDDKADITPGPGVDPKKAPKTKPGDEPRRGNKNDKGDKVPKDRPGSPGDDQPGKKPKMKPGDQPVPEPNADPADPKREPKKDPKADPKDTPRREPKGEPADVPKPGPKADPKDMPKREPRVEPKDSPKRKPRVEPQDSPKREPKTEPQDKPRSQPKAEPPKREPKAEPQPAKPAKEPADPQGRNTKDKPKDKGKEKSRE